MHMAHVRRRSSSPCHMGEGRAHIPRKEQNKGGSSTKREPSWIRERIWD